MRREMEENAGTAPLGGVAKTEWMLVHLLSAQEVKSLFQDVVEGLAFLVSLAFGFLNVLGGGDEGWI